MADYGSTRKNQYFVPGEGIHREVIQADICKYLDNDATVRPMTYQGREGYMLYAYRNLTSAMVDDLKRDSAAWIREERDRRERQPGSSHRSERHRPGGGRGGDGGGASAPEYVDSNIHARRQATGPTIPRNGAPVSDTSSPGMVGEYTHARPPPSHPSHSSHMDYGHQQPSPQHEMQYGVQSPPSAYAQSSARDPGYPVRDSGYPAAYPPGSGMSSQPRGVPPTSQGYGNYEYPSEPGFGGNPLPPQSSMAPRGYPQPPATAPPVSLRDPRAGDGRYPMPESRPDPRMPGRPDPRDPYSSARDPRYPVESSRPDRGFDQPRGYSDRDRRYGR